MSHPEQPPPGDQERVAQSPPETPEERTQELPPVPPVTPAYRPPDPTAAVPLLDLLAPQEPQLPQDPPAPVPPPGVAPPPQAVYQPYAGYAPPPAPRFRRRANRRAALIIGGIGAVVLVVALIGWALSTLPSSGGGRQARQSTPAVSSTSAVPTGVRAAGGYEFTQHAARTDTDCAANAYGKVAEYFATTPCTRLDRALYGTTVDGRLVVASVSVVHMPDDAQATALRKLADTSGTGNVNDLLRAGVRVPGGPESLTSAGYASTHDGAVVVIAEADFADREARDGDLLDRVSKAALELRA